MDKNFRIIERNHTNSKGVFGNPIWYVQEWKKNWFGYSRWVYIEEMVCGYADCDYQPVRFKSVKEAQHFIDNVLCKDIRRNDRYEKVVSECGCENNVSTGSDMEGFRSISELG